MINMVNVPTAEFVTDELGVIKSRLNKLEADFSNTNVTPPETIPSATKKRFLQTYEKLVSKLYMRDAAPYKTVASLHLGEIPPDSIINIMCEVHVDPRPDDRSRECATVTDVLLYSDDNVYARLNKAAGNDLMHAKKTIINRVGMYHNFDAIKNASISFNMRAINLSDRGECRISWVNIQATIIS